MKDTTKDDTLLPEKWRNKLFKFMAGGYDGCTCHPAALFITGDGRVRLIGSDGGSGGLDAGDWYSRTMRSFLESRGVMNSDQFLYGPHKSDKNYQAYLKYVSQMTEERHRKERLIVRAALEAEVENGNTTGSGWDHEFEEPFDISTPEKVREACKAMCHAFMDVYYHVGIADKLAEEGYEGAGFICSDCGEYVESTDYERFSDCVDPDAYKGIGGLAVAYTRVLCDECRRSSECPSCQTLGLPSRKEQQEGHATDHMDFKTAFGYEFVGVCEYCWDGFWRKHDDEKHDDEKDTRNVKMENGLKAGELMDELENCEKKDAFLEPFVSSCRKFAEHKTKNEGWTLDQVKDSIAKQVLGDAENSFPVVTKLFRETLVKNAMAAAVNDYFKYDINEVEIDPMPEQWKELLG